ncbi:MAG: substrate-binding domain-containing protein [Candidatus Eisenbacteria bacterium]|nr:substrate-binding domain-containing protein [Candidatus Eisenbacteria bacterium]
MLLHLGARPDARAPRQTGHAPARAAHSGLRGVRACGRGRRAGRGAAWRRDSGRRGAGRARPAAHCDGCAHRGGREAASRAGGGRRRFGAGHLRSARRAARGVRRGRVPELTFAGSGCLLAQAELSGRGDLFIPGELLYIEQARARGLAGPPVPIAVLRPVIAVARGNPLRIRGLADLARRGVRVGLGDPQSVAVGIVAERLLAARRDRAAILANVRTRALNVNEIGSQIALGALDAGVVWDASVPLFAGKLEAVSPAEMAGERSVVAGAVLATARSRGAAEAFLAFLASEDGAAIFRSYGYLPYRDAAPAAASGTPGAGAGSSPDSRSRRTPSPSPAAGTPRAGAGSRP